MIDLVRHTQSGRVSGYSDTHPLRSISAASEPTRGPRQPVLKWLGIPYAQARRFERPEPSEPWNEIRSCFEFGSMFPQPPSNTEVLLSKLPGFIDRSHVPVSEHSHFVNVFAPGDLQEGETLPVLVWIYGGALNNGTADRFLYDPTEWIRDGTMRGQRCIVVTGNYRTNILGFIAHDDLAKEDKDSLCGNYGLYDCVAMLEWVQQNITAFGGDSGNVTVFGQSAGAFIVSHLLVSGKKLFNKAICQSGAAGTMMLRPVEKAFPAYETILSSLPIPPTASPLERLEALRAASVEQLLSLHTATHSFTGLSLTLEPKNGYGIWTEDTLSRLERGEWDEWVEAVVIGTTEDEGSAFAWGMKLTAPEAFSAYVSQFPPATQARIREKYLAPFDGEHPPADSPLLDYTTAPGSRVLSDQVFVNPCWDQAVALAGDGGEGRGMKMWMYKLRTGVETLLKFSPIKLGIVHSMDLPLVFNSSSLWAGDMASASGKTARAMGERWMRFAIEGNPDPAWTPFTQSSPSQLVFSEGGQVANESLADFVKEKLELFFSGHGRDEAGEEVLGRANE
ncbi:hypothetical protein JCM11641_008272 [Rhodosporidiobolus odoratus]